MLFINKSIAGYEWWLMTEAKKRNPNILLSTLAWCVPGWVGGPKKQYFNQDNINYHIKWLQGAKQTYNLSKYCFSFVVALTLSLSDLLAIDYMGIWTSKATMSLGSWP